MKKLYYIVFYLLAILPFVAFGQKDSVQGRLVLIGDAGDFHGGHHPVIEAVKRNIKFDNKTTIVYLGDNLYYTGLPDPSYRSYDIRKAVLDTQINIARGTPAKVFFIPGNHDWNRFGKGGWETVVRQQTYIDSIGNKKGVEYEPKGGCPGPVPIEISNDVLMIIMDSQWWLHPFEKPRVESDCPYKTTEEVLNEIENIVTQNSKKLILFVCHHPFKSYGIHGGYFTLKQHIFPFTEMKPNLYIPLPVIGSIYPIARSVFGTPQDLQHPVYAQMIKDVQKVVKKHPNVIFISGHEHNLQLIKDSNYHYIISGAGTKKSRVAKNKHELFGAAENGFATLEISKNKNVRAKFYTVTNDTSKLAYDSVLLNFSKIPQTFLDSNKSVAEAAPFKDSIIAAINKKYDSVSGLHRIVLGENYRKEWATPVHLKVFNLNKEKGGLTIKSLGGGKQTQSLRLEDKAGRQWFLRCVNKDPQGALPENFRNSVAQHIVQDMISASHPYAPLAIPDLAKAAKVVVAQPTYYFVPDDPALNFYRPLFANTICALEEREPTPDTSDTKSTATVLNKMYDDNDNHVDQKAALRARLLDILIGDWDRHFGQWRFGSIDTGKGKIFYPIPRDRDQAFFKANGLLIKGVSANLLPYLTGFRKDIPRINWFNWSARDFDRLFLNELSKEDWINISEDIKRNMTDEVITRAVKKMPPAIFALKGQLIIDKLKSRRDILTKEALKYYNFLSKDVNIIGSNKKEYFKVSGVGDDLQVKVFKRTKASDSATLIYNRIFDHKNTREVRLYGLAGNDVFEVDDQAKAGIRLRLIGGRGNDTFNVRGSVHNDIYDLKDSVIEKNTLLQHSHSRLKISSNPAVNRYDATDFKYNIYRFPRVNIGYNPEDKLMVGIGLLYRTYRFRKEPYSTQQRLSTLYAPASRSYQLKYNAEVNQLIGNTDVVLNTEFVNPTLNNFFGLGNETVKNPNVGLEYYRVRYKYAQAELLFRQRPFSVLSLSAGPVWFHYWNEYKDNKQRILSTPSMVGLDSASIYSNKSYIGGKLGLLLNNVNSELLPTRGVYWNTQFTSLAGITTTSKAFTQLTSDLTLYSSLASLEKLVSVLRLGGGHIYSKNYEYFQALNLGANNVLRGFRKNRFSGRGLAYGSLELRGQLFNSKSYYLPGPVGLIGFAETGRVWVKNEDSKKWHYSYGGGLFYAPFNAAIVSGTVGFSPEENIFNFSIGTKFNINF
jgi:hypothetical protein